MYAKIFKITSMVTMMMIGLSVANFSLAALVSTDEVASQAQHELSRDRLMTALDRGSVQRKMASLGVDLHNAKLRVANMTDQEIAELQSGIDKLPAGAGGGGDLLVTILLVLVVLDILGVTDIFTFIN